MYHRENYMLQERVRVDDLLAVRAERSSSLVRSAVAWRRNSAEVISLGVSKIKNQFATTSSWSVGVCIVKWLSIINGILIFRHH